MSVIVELNKVKIQNLLELRNYDEIENYLATEFRLVEDKSTGQRYLNKPSTECLNGIIHIINRLKSNLEANEESDELIKLLRQCFITLRNIIAIHKSVQKELPLDFLNESFLRLLQSKESYQNCLIMFLQLIGNLVVDNRETQLIIWNRFHQNLIDLFQPLPNRIPNIVGMIIYNIFLDNYNLITSDILINCLNLIEGDTDYAQLILELFIKSEIIVSIHRELEIKHRLIVLEIVHDMIPNVSLKYIKLLAEDFKSKSDCILKTVTDYLKSIEPIEVVQLLDIIARTSSIDSYRSSLQTDKSLFINAVFLLKSIHEAGKLDGNHFVPINKLSLNDNEEIKEQPSFGFKASLIRLIGNLCWKCKENQDLLRELEGIALLLDCCNIDARNPFIIQCVVLAVRSICEGNMENQNVIAGMTKIKTIDSAMLKEMGLVLNDGDDNKITIMPYENDNKI